MDRALDPETLADALGEHTPGVLPSVEELAEMIADMEVRAFMGPSAIDDDLLRAGWYLHGVASAAAAGELYTPERQQRAFAVSAHIFDLALNQAGRQPADRLTLAFAAQVGFRRSDLDPNATAIWRRVDPLLDAPVSFGDTAEDQVTPRPTGEVDSDAEAQATDPDNGDSAGVQAAAFMTLALRAGVAFLGLDVRRVGELLNVWTSEITAMRSLIDLDTLASTMFGPAEAVTTAVSDLMAFLRYGDRVRLQAAQAGLRSVIDLTAGEGDHDARWVAAHLLTIADGMESSSVWSVLPPDTPDVVAQAFTVGTPPVLTLWPPQRDLLRRLIANPLDPSTKRLLLSLPTSAGKTLIAQLIICHHLATQPGNVCYVTPLRSLGREMRAALNSRLRVLQKGLGGEFPDFGTFTVEEFFALIDEPADSSVEVMTPERLAHLLRHDPEGVLERYSMFVIDEAHLLAQPGRGFILESILAVLATTDARLILLSGVMGNAQQVAGWLDGSEPQILFSSAWRGPRRLHALLHSHILWDREQRLPPTSRTFTHRNKYPIIADLRVRPAEGNVKRLGTSPDAPIGELDRDTRPNGTFRSQQTAFYRMCARTARELMPAGSLLMILSRRDYARNAAQEVANLLPHRTSTTPLCEYLEERLGAEHPLVDCVRHGVAYHHAGLPVDVLDALEQAMRSELLLGMFATSTLTDGVNLPVRTVLICETRYEGQDPAQQLDGPRLLNAVGRAGRAGKETEGWIVLGLPQAPNDDAFNVLRPVADELEIRSTLSSEIALERLAEAHNLIADTADALFQFPEGEVSDFSAFVWFVLSATERLGALAADVDLLSAIRGLLAFVQLPEDLANQWLELARYVEQRYLETPPASRLRWTLTGTGLGSSRRIEAIATQVADQITARHGALTPTGGTHGPVTHAVSTADALDAFEATGAFENLLALPEAGNVWRFKPTVNAKTGIEVNVTQALRGWLTGMDVSELAEDILSEVSDVSWRLEQTVDAVSGAFEHLLSWTVGVVTAQANELLEERGGMAAIPDELGSLIRYGVDTTTALNLLRSGVRSRRLAHGIGRTTQARDIEWSSVREWLRGLHIVGWREHFSAAPREVEDLAEFCRSPARSPLRQLLEVHETTIDLRYPMDRAPANPLPVGLVFAEPSDPIEVWTQGYDPYLVGIVGAASHADILLIRGSGVLFTATTDGATLTLRDSR